MVPAIPSMPVENQEIDAYTQEYAICSAGRIHVPGTHALSNWYLRAMDWRVIPDPVGLGVKVAGLAGRSMRGRKVRVQLPSSAHAACIYWKRNMSTANENVDDDAIVAATRRWVDRAVVGLNLCPFAKAVQVKDQVRYVVSQARSPESLLDALMDELQLLADTDPEQIDTTLLIHPYVLQDFLDFNEFLDVADAAVEDISLDGELQIASFHPDYQFADTDPNDISNYTNRAPYPTLQLLREDSIDRAVEAIPDAAEIFEKNIDTMEQLGHEGWDKLDVGPAR